MGGRIGGQRILLNLWLGLLTVTTFPDVSPSPCLDTSRGGVSKRVGPASPLRATSLPPAKWRLACPPTSFTQSLVFQLCTFWALPPTPGQPCLVASTVLILCRPQPWPIPQVWAVLIRNSPTPQVLPPRLLLLPQAHNQ